MDSPLLIAPDDSFKKHGQLAFLLLMSGGSLSCFLCSYSSKQQKKSMSLAGISL
jgi:hypothetical protein